MKKIMIYATSATSAKQARKLAPWAAQAPSQITPKSTIAVAGGGAYPGKISDGRYYVMRRIKDGRYMCVIGWSVQWSNIPTVLCPLFCRSNMGPGRYDDWHRQTYARFRKPTDNRCELVPYNAI